jgi:hypothetical protein
LTNPIFSDKKNLTAEVAEHAEVKMAKSSGSGCNGQKGPLLHPSRRLNTAKGLSRNDLCALCLLCVHPLVFNPRGSKGKEESISMKWFMFFVVMQKKLCGLCVLCG